MREETALALAGTITLALVLALLAHLCQPPARLVGYQCAGGWGPAWADTEEELSHCRRVEPSK